MTSTNETNQQPSPQSLLKELHQIYGKRCIRPDPFGKRAALPSEVARVVAQGESLRHGAVREPDED